jgi:ankyrin repeat protein
MRENKEFSQSFIEEKYTEAYNELEDTIWHVIAKNRHAEIIKNGYFQLDPREVNLKNKLGLTPLNIAVENDDLEMVIELAKHGAKVLEGGGSKVLTRAVKNNNPEMFDELIKCGAKISDIDKLKLLTYALEKNNPKMIEFLILNLKINNIANLENKKRKRDLTLLHKACLQGSLNICQQLIKVGADINATCIWQNHQDNEANIYLENATPLHLAIISKNELIVKELIDNKATLITKCPAVKSGNFFLDEKLDPRLICEDGSKIFLILDEALIKQEIDSSLSSIENIAPDLELSCKRIKVNNLVVNNINEKMVK